MTERPILFSAEMVRAIVDGRKTQTRRPFTTQAPVDVIELGRLAGTPTWHEVVSRRPLEAGPAVRSIFGAPGDLLYVRESYAPNYHGPGRHGFRADWSDAAADVVPEPRGTPSIHMRKEHARIWLRVVDVRVHQLGDITDADAIAEGCAGHPVDGHAGYPVGHHPRDEFADLWDSIYASTIGLSWAVNPWVWACEFKVESTTGRGGVK